MKLTRVFLFFAAIVNTIGLKAQLTIEGIVKHAAPTSTSSVGNITLNVNGGTPPYTYSWSPGGATTKDINAVTRNNYTVTINDAGTVTAVYPYSLGYKTKWKDIYGMQFRNDSLLAGAAVSKNTLLLNQDGWAEFVLGSITGDFVMGFTDSVSAVPVMVEDIDFGVNCIYGSIYYYLGGSYGHIAYQSAGDVIRIERVDTMFNIKQNGVVLFSCPMPKNKNFKLKARVYSEPKSNIGASFMDSTNISFPNYVQDIPVVKHCTPGSNNGFISLSPKPGETAHTYTWSPGSYTTSAISSLSVSSYTANVKDADLNKSKHIYNVGYKTAWKDVGGMVFRNDSMLAGYGLSKNTLQANEDGWAEFVLGTTTSDFVLGFTDSVAPVLSVAADIDFGVNCAYGAIYYYLNGSYGYLSNQNAGDILRIERVDTIFNIKQNGALLFSYPIPGNKNLKLKSVVYTEFQSNIGASFMDSTYMAFPNYVRNIPLIKHSSGTYINDGSISLSPKAGDAMHSYTWTSISEHSSKIDNRVYGTYNVTIADTFQNTSNYNYDILYKAQWTNLDSCIVRNDSLMNIYGYAGWSTASSKNILRANNTGEISWVLDNITSYRMLGFVDTLSGISGDTYNIDEGVYVALENMYYWNNGFYYFIARTEPGDIIKIKRSNDSIFLVLNNAIVFTNTVANAGVDWVVKAVMYPGHSISDIGCSFTPTLSVNYNIGHVLSPQEPNSGYIYLMPKDGHPRYTFLWDNDSTSNSLTDLAAGTYSVYVTDSLALDTVYLSFTIGQQAKLTALQNMNINQGQFVKSDIEHSAAAFMNGYCDADQNGAYEFKVSNTATHFNFVFSPFDPGANEHEQIRVAVKQTTVHIAWTDLPLPGTADYLNINFADTVTTTDSANVIQKEFMNDTCNFNSGCSRLTVSGIQFDYGNIYVLSDGVTILKGTPVTDNVTIELGINSDVFTVTQNNTHISSSTLNNTTALIGSFTIKSPLVALEDLSLSPLFLPFIDVCTAVCSNDQDRNWTHTTTYDEYGSVVSLDKEYFDYLGRATQSQAKNLSENNILATEVLYDAYGRAVGQSLPAPINQTCFCYKDNFITNSGNTAYTFNDFDIPNYTTSSSVLTSGEADKPKAVGTGLGTVGWYYSNANTLEKYVPIAQTPYSRMHYSRVDPSSALKVSKPGDKLNSGSSHEAYNYKMATMGELNHVFGAGLGWRIDKFTDFYETNQCTAILKPAPLLNTAPQSLKSITVDENGIETVSFVDLSGNQIASCLAGKVNGSNVKTQLVQSWLSFTDETKRYLDVHLPDGCETSLSISYPGGTPATWPVFNVIDLKTGELVKFSSTVDFTGTTPSLPPGFYRIFVKTIPAGQLGVNIIQKLNYYNFTLNYYDYANRLKASVSPKGFDDAYAYTAFPNNSNPYRVISVITSTANPVTNFDTNKTWSLDTASFVNTIPLNLPALGQDSSTNYALKLSIFAGNAIGTGEIPGSPSTDARTGKDSTAQSNFLEQKYTIATNTIVVINADSIPEFATDVYFKVKLALLDVNDSVIGNTIRETEHLKCHVQISHGVYYRTWQPVDFYFEDNFENIGGLAPALNWRKIKIIQLHPIDTLLGDSLAIYHTMAADLKLVASGVSLVGPTKPAHKMVERYRYNSWGELQNTVATDGGQTDYVYAIDGKTKFTQNAKQDASHATAIYRKFSYMDYDSYDRPITGGEFTPPTVGATFNYFFDNYEERGANLTPTSPQVSVHQLAEVNNGNVFGPDATDIVNMVYDRYDPAFYAETGLSQLNYVQKHLAGEISYSYNTAKKTWYSYDEQGRLEWVVQKYYGINTKFAPNEHMVKTFNYKYNTAGQVAEMAFNKEDATDRFYHYYQYDQDLRLKRVYTSRDGIVKTIQAKYDFYLHGPLKRVELANKMQGLDMVYTINGWLKAVNGPEMEKNYDAGKDGYLANTANNTTYKDIFGLNLEYYLDDYERVGTYVQSYDDSQNAPAAYAPDLFNGIVKGERWQTRTPAAYTGLSYANQQLMYGYQYDKKYQLKQANFATIDNNSTQNYAYGEYIVSPAILQTNITSDYRVHGLTYDYNGNILTLKRNAWTASANGIDLDDLSYTYASCSNKLSYVSDAISTNPYAAKGFEPGQSSGNYHYNALGELTQNTNDAKKYEYNSFGNVTAIRDGSNNLLATYVYDEMGYRIRKTAHHGGGDVHTWYVRDAEGQIITTYEKTGTYLSTDYVLPAEWNVYAGSRVGILDNTGGIENYIYELSDQLGNVRATFKQQGKTAMSSDFNGAGADDNWFSDNGTLNNSLAGPLNLGYSIKTQQPAAPFGAGSKLIPVKTGDNVTIDWKSLYTSSGIPAAGMVVQLTDAAGNILPNCWQIFAVGGTQNTWENNTFTYAISATYPDMYLSCFPWNTDNTGKVAWFDDLAITFNSGSVQEPEQLNMATYYPHGSVMPGMNYNTSYKYKYGYQGQFAEADDESNESFFELRNYDPLIGRFLTRDPKNQYFSPYLAMGNSHPNMIDQDGGVAAAFGSVVGAIAGAVVGVGVNYAMDKLGWGFDGNEKGKIDKAGWTYLASGFVGAFGGSISGAVIQNGGKLNGANFFGFELTKRQHTGITKKSKWYFKQPTYKNLNINFHFSFGISIANIVLLDIRFNSTGDNNFQENFPGRSWGFKNPYFRFSFLYTVWPKNSGNYKLFSKEHFHTPFCFFGGYAWFFEHLGVGDDNISHHK